jgi:CRP-like cAMP-binding protein
MDVLLQNFSQELNPTLMKLGVKKIFSANELIFSEGEEATFLPIVLTGKVKMVRYPEVGKEIILGVFQSGEIFAIPPALDGKRFPATAVAIEDSQLLMLPRRDFLDLMSSSSEFSSIVMGRMCGILRDRADTLQILATPSAEHRVANVLLRLAGEVKENEVKKISHRRQDIAEMSGLSLETTIRMIRRLEDKGYLKIIRGRIFLETTAHLRQFVQ